MRQQCDSPTCTNAAVAYIADYEADQPVSRFVCANCAPAGTVVRS